MKIKQIGGDFFHKNEWGRNYYDKIWEKVDTRWNETFFFKLRCDWDVKNTMNEETMKFIKNYP